jgi:ATP-dependent Clp protease protease subunit
MLAKHCNRTIEEIERDTDRDNFMSSQESMDYGLIDKVYTSRSEIGA